MPPRSIDDPHSSNLRVFLFFFASVPFPNIFREKQVMTLCKLCIFWVLKKRNHMLCHIVWMDQVETIFKNNRAINGNLPRLITNDTQRLILTTQTDLKKKTKKPQRFLSMSTWRIKQPQCGHSDRDLAKPFRHQVLNIARDFPNVDSNPH